ncbi:TraB/GumN family protein [Paraburkholderia silvatlantica]|uniref:TraB/GumN family protein n=1 Tax=Paraburkholderia silvatlantica TaxID=321895 RepID=UPI003750BE67
MWTASLPGHPTLLLLPTVHLLAHEDPRIDATLAELAGNVRAIVLEGPVSIARDQLPLIERYGRYPASDNLTNHVKSMTPAALAQCARDSDWNIVKFLQLKMWLAAGSLDAHRWRVADISTARAGKDRGATVWPGIDMRLQALAQKNRVPLIYLQTLDDALKLMDAMPQEAQEAYLSAACAALHGFPPGYASIEVFQRAWTDADTATLERLVTTRAAGESEGLFESTEYIMAAGTRAFSASIERDGYFYGKGPILVAVGAGHFFGPDSLIDRLKQAGYTITPAQHPAIVSRYLPKTAP